MTEVSMNVAWESVRMGVCRRCIDGDAMGECRLPNDEVCPLEVNFEAISKTIAAANKYSLESIARDVRGSVCPRCVYGTSERCAKRDSLECALERYMPVIVERVVGMRTYR
jgi:hypothetical protein